MHRERRLIDERLGNWFPSWGDFRCFGKLRSGAGDFNNFILTDYSEVNPRQRFDGPLDGCGRRGM